MVVSSDDLSNSFAHQVKKEVPTKYSPKLDNAIATDKAILEDLATESESLREDEISTSNSNVSSGKGDLDSVGQDIAKSMMTVLLPRALPLLNTFSRKKKKNLKPSEMSAIVTTSENEKIDRIAIPGKASMYNSLECYSLADLVLLVMPQLSLYLCYSM